MTNTVAYSARESVTEKGFISYVQWK